LKVLTDLGAELVESVDPQYPDDPAIPNMAFSFQEALAEIIPFHMPEVLSWKTADGKPEFSVAGHDVTTRKYLTAAAAHKVPWPANLNIRRMIANLPPDAETVSGYQFSYNFAEYLTKRGDSRVYDWETLNANAKYHSDARRAAMKNWENKPIDIRTEAVTFTIKRRDAVRMAVMKVLEQNDIDVFVNPSATTMARKLGGPGEVTRRSYGHGATLGTPEVFVPAGFNDVSYETKFALSADATKYENVPGTEPTKLANPLPFNIGFWAGPGEEATILKVASAYEAATKHRKAPPGFGPVKGEPGYK
jgi:amidase